MERFLKCGEVAKILSVHASTIRKYANVGLIEYRRNPYGWLEIKESEIPKIKKIIRESRSHYLRNAKTNKKGVI